MSNKLITERSPYLLAHAENPVDWYPWCDAAFEKARAEDKPIFLSIGYSTCHYCHLMARECFEDEEVAAILNKNFVSIKVDREERPDVDAVYMRFCQALTGSGGWPLTILMSPDGKPFFAATYLPKRSDGRTFGLIELLSVAASRWSVGRDELLKAGADALGYVLKSGENEKPGRADREILKKAAEQFKASYDKEYGGFGMSTKFPCGHDLLFLLRYAKLSGDSGVRSMVEHTLRQMYRGGIFDHFGGGFSRYSTDREWLRPHFEKTLYDNALLIYTYAEAWQEGRMALYKDVAMRTIDYCLKTLRNAEGGFFCGQDADSDGVEGAYYLFTPDEIKNVLGEDEGRHFCECYDITDEGNVGKSGKSIPNLLLNQRWAFVPEGYGEYRERLVRYRDERHRLATDTKVLCSWNGLMLMALSKAARCFDSSRALSAAQKLADLMAEKFGAPDALKSVCYGDISRERATLSDYAFYALGLLELYRADFDASHIALAIRLADEIEARFKDAEGGYFDSTDGDGNLIFRPKELDDGALPAGNSAAAVLFSSLFRLTADVKWRKLARNELEYICAGSSRYPAGRAFALTALMDFVYPSRDILCVSEGEDVPELLSKVLAPYSPELSVLLKTPARAASLAAVAPFTADSEAKDGKTTFYICRDGACSLPIG